MTDSACWCGVAHPERPADIGEAWSAFWHLLAAEMRLPQTVAWLARRMTGAGR